MIGMYMCTDGLRNKSIARLSPLHPELLDYKLVLPPYHFIQKEVVPINLHFSTDGVEATKPYIGLLRNR